MQDYSVLIFDLIQLLLNGVEFHARVSKILHLSVHSSIVLLNLVFEGLYQIILFIDLLILSLDILCLSIIQRLHLFA
jgi:fumarate reductase subunit C